jgi:hypothetical protein
MKKVAKNCLWCEKVFEVSEYTHRRGNGKFCSLSCVGKHTADKNKVQPNTECGYCKVPVYRNGSDIRSSKTKNFFCCYEHKALAQSFGEILYDNECKKDYRLIAFRRVKLPQCERCGFSNKDALEVHHKDKNRKNNLIENLEIVCANCHSIEHRSLK